MNVKHYICFFLVASQPLAVPPAPSPGKTSRYDTSLGLLTKRFVDLLQTAPDGTVDLNKVCQHCKEPVHHQATVMNVQLLMGNGRNIMWLKEIRIQKYLVISKIQL